MSRRREFTRTQKEAIVLRATVDGIVRCEGCKLALKPGAHEVDHIIPEGLRSEEDKRKPLTIADGQLLGKACCHRGKDGKTNADVKQIAKAKRQSAGHKNIRVTPVVKIPSPAPTVSERTAKSMAKERLPALPRRNVLTQEVIRD